MDQPGLTSMPASSWKAFLSLSQLELTLFVGFLFVGVSVIFLKIEGRSRAYFVSQFLGLAFIILAVGFLFEKVASARIEHHFHAQQQRRDALDPNIPGAR
jgi:uncharacterized membrane protein